MIGRTRRLSVSSSALPRSAAYFENVPSSSPPATPTVQLLMRAALATSSSLTGLLGIGSARFGAWAIWASTWNSDLLWALAGGPQNTSSATQQSGDKKRSTLDLPLK